MPHRAVLAAAAVALAVAACSGDDDTAGPSTTTTASTAGTTTAVPGLDRSDPCALLTAEEASSLVGIAFGPGLVQEFADGAACIYIQSDTFVGVQVLSEEGTADELAANAPEFAADAVPLEGVGEAAFISEEEASVGVLQDGLIFSVTLAVAGQPASRDLVLMAADLVLARLG